MYQCEKCGKEVIVNFATGRFCSRSCANSRPCSEEKKLKTSTSVKKWLIKTYPKKYPNGHVPFTNKNKCPKCGNEKKITAKLCIKCNRKDPSWRLAISNGSKGKSGGYREKGGRGKHGWYKGYWCDSSWELAWVIYNLEHGIKFERNKQGFEYEFEGRKFKYYPDFILEDGSYVEIKGYNSKQFEAKKQYFKGVLNIFDKTNIKPFINYVITKYSKDYIKLYKSGNSINSSTASFQVEGAEAASASHTN